MLLYTGARNHKDVSIHASLSLILNRHQPEFLVHQRTFALNKGKNNSKKLYIYIYIYIQNKVKKRQRHAKRVESFKWSSLSKRVKTVERTGGARGTALTFSYQAHFE